MKQESFNLLEDLAYRAGFSQRQSQPDNNVPIFYRFFLQDLTPEQRLFYRWNLVYGSQLSDVEVFIFSNDSEAQLYQNKKDEVARMIQNESPISLRDKQPRFKGAAATYQMGLYATVNAMFDSISL